jgi:predicted CoA-binding protein
MPTLDQAVDEFLGLKRIAVAGVSRDSGGAHAGNGIYSRLKDRGYEAFPVNPNADNVMGDACFRSLNDIPDGVEGVVIATNPKDALSVAQECNELGISKVWIHKNIGAGTYSSEARDYCRENDITMIVSCPLWYGKTSDGFHRFFGATCRLLRQVPSEV